MPLTTSSSSRRKNLSCNLPASAYRSSFVLRRQKSKIQAQVAPVSIVDIHAALQRFLPEEESRLAGQVMAVLFQFDSQDGPQISILFAGDGTAYDTNVAVDAE